MKHKPTLEGFNLTSRLNRCLAVVVLMCVVILASPTARAAVMAYEGFNYSSGGGNLTGQNGGFGWRGTWQGVNNGSSSVQAGSLSAGANAPAGYDSLSSGNSAFTPNNTRTGRFLDTSAGGSFGVKGYVDGNGNIGAPGKTIYISFMQQPNGTTSYYEFEFHRGNLGDSGRYGGIGNDSGGNTGVYLRVPAAGQTLIGSGSTAVSFYVVRIDFLVGSNNVSVYQNPTSAIEPASATLSVTNIGNITFNGISLGCFNNSRTVVHDEIRLGETWGDVVSPAGPFSAGNWDGGGADGNWSTGGNWDNNVVPIFAVSLTFAGSTRLNNNNDLTGVSANSITFDAAAGAFTLNGNSLGLYGNIAFSANPASPVTQTINLPLTPNQDFTIGTRTNGNITINGNITAVNQLTQTGPDNAGILTLGGTNSLKGLVVNNGTNRITGTTVINGIGGSSFFYVPDAGSGRNATLIIENGASLIVTNGFQDAAVIARDGASGRIIQNGGRFDFAINDGAHNFLFVGASGQPNAHAEYDMNGGVLDMHGDTLGIALGANTVITGLVNQVSGVITNVGQVVFSPFFTQGHGIYNLTGGSLYIGGINGIGITNFPGSTNEMNLGGGTVSATASWSSSLNMNLTGINGPVTFDPNGYTITLLGSLSGSGGLTVNGAGVLALDGANTYTGNLTVTSGSIVQFDTTGTTFGSIRLNNGALLNLNYSGTRVAASFYTNGVALPIGTYNAGNLPGFIAGSGDLQVASGISMGIWDGGGANNNWSTGGNWDQDAVPGFPIGVTFAGSTRLANNNDLSGITANSITFDAAAGAFVIGGNDITLNGNIGFNGTPAALVTQTVNLGMTWSANLTLNTPTNGNLALGGNISASANNLTKTGAGNLTLGGVDTFAGYSVNGGTSIITGNTTVNGTGGRMYVGDGVAIPGCTGTLSIPSGGAFTFTGSYGDYLVIGRDSGNGRIVQNGGNFDFNPSDSHNILLIAAGGGAHGYGEYNISGGTLDMHGNTLGAGWGDGGTVTGVVNQAGGDIINLFKLDVGVVKASGLGIYNLSGGSIALDFGGITSDSGSYQVNLGGGTVSAIFDWTSSLNLNLTNVNGSVKFDPAGNTITLSGALSGNGGLIVTNSGTLKISGASTYTGDTFVSAGTTLQYDVAGASSSVIRMVDGAMLNLNYSGTRVVSAFFTNGVALADGIYNNGNLSGFINGSGDLQVASAISTGLWDGGGANNNWSTAANWDFNAEPVFPIGLTFAGSARLLNNNDLSGIAVSSITFDAAAGAFVLNGNDITLNGTVGFNGTPVAPVTQTANLNMTWSASKTITVPTNASLALGGNIATSANDLTKTGNGTLALGGVDSFAGFAVNGGTNVITGNVSANGTGGSRFVLANANAAFNGTLIIQPGATLTVTGNFTDAAVIGRDGGKGTVIQNGGTLTFNPSNNQLFLLGASGNSATRAEYDMNGGVFDMSNFKLGVGLGAGVLITGIVNQVSGVITNVGNLDLGTLTPNGRGIYNLSGGSIYIGTNGITSYNGIYTINLGGGTVGAYGNWASTLNMTLTGINGPVTFDTAANTITLSGALSGSGGLTVASAGTLELSGANTYTGDTVVNAGILKLDSTSNSSGTFKVANGAMLNLNYGSTMMVANFITNNVALAVGTYNSANLPAYITGVGSIQVTGAIPTTPTHLSYSFVDGQITLSWPPSYLGWILQVQTNSLNAGLGTNWVDIPDSAYVTNLTVPFDPAAPAVFSRLRYPSP